MTAAEKLAPEEYLARRVDDLDGHWLELHCGGAQTFFPFKLLAKTCGTKRVDEVHHRFRCKMCRGRPVRIGVTNNAARGLQYDDVWTVTLLDATAG